MASMSRMAWVLLLMAALAPPSVAGVTVVDATSPTPVLQAAIDAAPAGEILLVLAGPSETAQTITIAGKGLVVVAWPAGSVVDVDRLRIEDSPAGSRVVVRGFRMTPALATGSYWSPGSVAGAALELVGNAGAVWIEDCEARSPDQNGNWAGYGNHGAALVGCANVVLMRCTFVAGNGAHQAPGCGAPFAVAAQDGGCGVSAGGSTVALHECTLVGDSGGGAAGGECPVPASAGDGLRLQYGSRALFAGCTAKGGNQAWTLNTAGSGIRVDEDSTLALRGSAALSGSGTAPPPPIVAAPGTLTQHASVPRQLEVSSPLGEGQPGTVTVAGQQGDLTALFMAFSGGSFAVPAKQGMFSLGTPFFGPFVLGSNPVPSGLWTIPFNGPTLTPAFLQGQSFLLQLVVHDGSQALFEGTSTLTVIDSAIP